MNQVKTNNSCCCIPIFLIKFWLFIGGGIHLLIGCVFIFISSVFKGDIKDYIPPNHSGNVDSISDAILFTGIVVLVSGFFGIVGGCKKIRICLCGFLIVAFLFFIIIFVIAILVSGVEEYLNDKIGNEEKCMGYLENQYNAYEDVRQYWCHQDYCPCKIDKEKVTDWQNPEYLQLIGGGYNSNNGYSNILDCQNHLTNVLARENKKSVDWENLQNNFIFLSFIESAFECSGMCKQTNFYIFSDVNNGPPKHYPENKACYLQLYSKVTSLFDSITGTLWGVVAVFLLNVIFGCCLICHPDRKEYYNQYLIGGAQQQSQDLELHLNPQNLVQVQYTNQPQPNQIYTNQTQPIYTNQTQPNYANQTQQSDFAKQPQHDSINQSVQ